MTFTRSLSSILPIALLALACGSSKGSSGDPPSQPLVADTCFSPTQNAEHAYDDGAQGCACEQTPENDAGYCVGGTAFICEDKVWVAVEDGPCWPPVLISADTCAMRGGEVLAASTGDAGTSCPAPAKLLAFVTSHDGVEQPCCSKVAANE